MAHKCAHNACTCDPMGKVYCSAHCTTASEMEEEPTWCECGHAACESRPRPATPPDR